MAETTIDVLIEIPRGSRNKYEYDHDKHVIRLDRRLFSATVYPSDYGSSPTPSPKTAIRWTRWFPPRIRPFRVHGSRPAGRRVLDDRRTRPRRQDHLRTRR